MAGAVTSVVAVVQLALPNEDGAETQPRREPKATLSLPERSVRVMSERDYLVSLGNEPPPGDKLAPIGFVAKYVLAVRGYPPGSVMLVRYEVSQLTATGNRFLRPSWTEVQVDRDPDRCVCDSTFIRLPSATARYRVVIGVFAPGVRKTNPGSPIDEVETEFPARA